MSTSCKMCPSMTFDVLFNMAPNMAGEIASPTIFQLLLVRFSFCLACWIGNRKAFEKGPYTLLVYL